MFKNFWNWLWSFFRHKIKPKAVFFIKYQHNKLNFMALTLNQGQKVVVGIQVIDSSTGNVLTSAKLSGQSYSADNTTILSIAPDAADATSEDVTAAAGGTANLSGSVTADLSAYGLGTSVVLPVAPDPITVVVPVTVTPQAVFVFGTPQ